MPVALRSPGGRERVLVVGLHRGGASPPNPSMSVDPMGLVREEMDMDKIDREHRIEAVKRLPDVAVAIGAEETRSTLLPFLLSKINNVSGSLEEDEVMLVLAEVLGKMVTEVGGGTHATSLIEPLVALASVEETLVRDMASLAMSKVVDQIHVDEANARLAFDGLMKMHTHEWFFARVSACAVAASVYKLCKSAMPPSDTTLITELREIYQTYAGDETPMVRRSAAENLGAYATSIDDDKLFNEHVLPMLQTVSADEQDSVRVLAIKQMPAVLKLLGSPSDTNHAEEHAQVLKLIIDAAQDVSWRVRDATSKCFPDFTRVYGGVGGQKAEELATLVKEFAQLLVDQEAEVRLSAVKSISAVAKGCGPVPFATDALPIVAQVISDTDLKVRIQLATEVMALVPIMADSPAAPGAVEMIFSYADQFLQDESVEVFLCVMTTLKENAPLLQKQEALLRKMLDWLTKYAAHDNWRVRRSVILAMAPVTKQLGEDEFRSNFMEIYKSSFEDKISKVRLAAAQAISSVRDAFGVSFVMTNVLQHLSDKYHSMTYYLYRIAAVEAHSYILSADMDSAVMQQVVQFLTTACEDSVPNVRYTAIKALGSAVQFADDKIVSEIRPVLTEIMNNKKDDDCSYEATVAIKSIS